MNKRFAVVDIETTGGLFRRDKITEIAIVITDGTKIIDEYATLINPGRSIPPFITKITGISDEMVADAPRFYEVARDIVERTEGHIFVAHNVRFDYGFIREEFSALGYAYNRQRLCTVQLSRKMLGLPSHSLEALIKYYGIQVQNRHRALDDARATAIVLQNLLEIERSQKAVKHQINRGVRESLLPETITIEDLHSLPEATGIYYMFDGDDQIVYVGKSRNIQKRIMQHFVKTTRKAERLQQRVRKIEYTLTGTDLMAQIVEAQEIRKHMPELNRAQRAANFNTYLKSTVNSLGYRRFDLVKSVQDWNGILNVYTGPKAGKMALAALIETHMLCPLYSGLEIGMGPCSMHQFDKCLGACIHEESPKDYNERADEAMAQVNNRFASDFLLIDVGRSSDEHGVILVRNGSYHGHGFVERSLSAPDHPASLADGIRKQAFYPEMNTFIRKAIEKNDALHIVPLSSE